MAALFTSQQILVSGENAISYVYLFFFHENEKSPHFLRICSLPMAPEVWPVLNFSAYTLGKTPVAIIVVGDVPSR